jgi:hypothetical protein
MPDEYREVDIDDMDPVLARLIRDVQRVFEDWLRDVGEVPPKDYFPLIVNIAASMAWWPLMDCSRSEVKRIAELCAKDLKHAIMLKWEAYQGHHHDNP